MVPWSAIKTNKKNHWILVTTALSCPHHQNKKPTHWVGIMIVEKSFPIKIEFSPVQDTTPFTGVLPFRKILCHLPGERVLCRMVRKVEPQLLVHRRVRTTASLVNNQIKDTMGLTVSCPLWQKERGAAPRRFSPSLSYWKESRPW